MKDTNPQIMWWYISLQPYDFHMLQHLDKAHANADFSRFGREKEVSGSPLGPILRERVCDRVYLPRTGQEKLNPTLWVEEVQSIGPPLLHMLQLVC